MFLLIGVVLFHRFNARLNFWHGIRFGFESWCLCLLSILWLLPGFDFACLSSVGWWRLILTMWGCFICVASIAAPTQFELPGVMVARAQDRKLEALTDFVFPLVEFLETAAIKILPRSDKAKYGCYRAGVCRLKHVRWLFRGSDGPYSSLFLLMSVLSCYLITIHVQWSLEDTMALNPHISNPS